MTVTDITIDYKKCCLKKKFDFNYNRTSKEIKDN